MAMGLHGVAAMKISARAGSSVHEVSVVMRNGTYVVEIDGARHEVDSRKLEGDFYSFLVAGRSYEVSVETDGDRYFVRHGAAESVVTLTDPGRAAREAKAAGAGSAEVVSVMPGKVVRVLVREGDEVEEGQGVVVVEAMKMENELGAPKAGKISAIKVQPGFAVEAGAALLTID
jgi:biotin carboxyl carrier protein